MGSASYSKATAKNLSTHVSTHAQADVNQAANMSASANLARIDRKFNLVVFGIEECPQRTAKHDRLTHDLSKVVDILSSIDDSINSSSIKDQLRLGKYSGQSERPRAVLVRMVRAADVTCILSRKGSLHSSHSIKPDLSWEDRQKQRTLLSERWKLIDSGVLRKNIKVRSNSLLVNNALYGKLDPDSGYSFKLCDDSLEPSSPESQVANPTMHMSQDSSAATNPVHVGAGSNEDVTDNTELNGPNVQPTMPPQPSTSSSIIATVPISTS